MSSYNCIVNKIFKRMNVLVFYYRTADGDFKMRETKPLMSHEMVLKKLILFLDSELTEVNDSQV